MTAKKAKTVKTETVAFVNVIKNALVARRDACISFELIGQADQLATPIKRIDDATMQQAEKVLTQTDFTALARSISYVDAKGKGIEQVKTIVKIATMLRALALNDASALDNNSRVGILALLQNDNHASVREMVCAQSKVAMKDADMFAVRETFKNLASYSVGTGNSQASQVRQVLNNFGLFEGFVKGQKNNDPKLTEYGQVVLTNLVYKKQATA